jgi:hypothetical protein
MFIEFAHNLVNLNNITSIRKQDSGTDFRILAYRKEDSFAFFSEIYVCENERNDRWEQIKDIALTYNVNKDILTLIEQDDLEVTA